MFISDLTYQEIAVESNNLEGGIDLGISFTGYEASGVKFTTLSTSNANGSQAGATVEKLNISTVGFNGIGLGLPNSIF